MISSTHSIRPDQVFGPNYKGFVKQVKYPNINRILADLTVPSCFSLAPDRIYSGAVLGMVNALGQRFSSQIGFQSLENARRALIEISASPATFSFITNYFNRAGKNGIDEAQAAKNVVDRLPAILISTARLAYPSDEGSFLVEGFRRASPRRQMETLQLIFLNSNPSDIERAVRSGFNPFNVIEGGEPVLTVPTDENLMRYMWLSKQALTSFANILCRKQLPNSPSPLWIFLLRDAHLLYLTAKDELPGTKVELDVSRFSLANPEELAELFIQRGYNPADRKGTISISGYDRLLDEFSRLGIRADSTPIAPKQLVANLIEGNVPRSEPSYDQSRFQFAQQILANLTVPEQIDSLLAQSGIYIEACQRPIVLVDTGFRGSLPLLLQTAIYRKMEQLGKRPQVHVWLDYAVDSFARLSFSHTSGQWSSSPLDGLACLNRTIAPNYEMDVFTTPFDFARQKRIIDPFDRFDEDQKQKAA